MKKDDVLIALDDINERFDVAQNQDALRRRSSPARATGRSNWRNSD